MKNNITRIYSLDAIRFIAAIFVMLYHYTFSGYLSNKMSLLNFPSISYVSRYGFLGVQLFFMISGFVILMSAQNKNILTFITSRMIRLYPAFWVSVTLTALVTVFMGGERYHVDLIQYLFNLTMISDVFHVRYIDGVYWTLLVEIKFYLCVWLLIVTRLIHSNTKLLAIFGFWSFLSLLNNYIQLPKIISFFLFPEYAPYFIAGAIFYIGYKDGFTVYKITIILITYITACMYIDKQLIFLSQLLHSDFNQPTALFIILVFYFSLLFISIKKIEGNNLLKIMGGVTYPLYLIHENIGFMIGNMFFNHVNKYILLISIIFLMLSVSYYIYNVLEKEIARRLTRFFNNLISKMQPVIALT